MQFQIDKIFHMNWANFQCLGIVKLTSMCINLSLDQGQLKQRAPVD